MTDPRAALLERFVREELLPDPTVPLTPGTRLLSDGLLDSLGAVRLAAFVEESFGVRFDDSDIFLKQMQAWFAQHMPAVRTVFKQISSVYLNDDPATWKEIKAKAHAAILGVGH